jgi:hypothetical protein
LQPLLQNPRGAVPFVFLRDNDSLTRAALQIVSLHSHGKVWPFSAEQVPALFCKDEHSYMSRLLSTEPLTGIERAIEAHLRNRQLAPDTNSKAKCVFQEFENCSRVMAEVVCAELKEKIAAPQLVPQVSATS